MSSSCTNAAQFVVRRQVPVGVAADVTCSSGHVLLTLTLSSSIIAREHVTDGAVNATATSCKDMLYHTNKCLRHCQPRQQNHVTRLRFSN